MRLRHREMLQAILVCALLISVGLLAKYFGTIDLDYLFAVARTQAMLIVPTTGTSIVFSLLDTLKQWLHYSALQRLLYFLCRPWEKWLHLCGNERQLVT